MKIKMYKLDLRKRFVIFLPLRSSPGVWQTLTHTDADGRTILSWDRPIA